MSEQDTAGATGGSAEAQAAETLGSTEGEVRQQVRESGLQHAAGNEANRAVWEQTPEGQEWLDGEDERAAQVAQENEDAEQAQAEQEDQPALDSSLENLSTESGASEQE